MPNRRGRTSGSRRALALGALTLATLLGASGVSLAVPPPPNPSDSELDSSRQKADAKADKVGRLTNRLAEAEARLTRLQNDVALKLEQANKALVDLQQARDAATQAERDANAARAEADAAASEIEQARASLDRFVAGSYRQGSTVGSVGAYLGAESPKDLLARAQLLDAVSGSQLDALDGMQQARIAKGNKDAAARKALQIAQQRRAQAEDAKAAADAAKAAAVRARQNQATRTSEIQASKEQVSQQLYAAQARVEGLEDQRQQYEEWQAQKEREEAARAREAAVGSGGSAPSAPAASPAAGSTIEAVIARAKSQLGSTYAWGGGNASGPTYGIRDGGVADAHGDYNKIGFDCSGLMIYAFAGVQSLPHYSGYQYTSGSQVPVSQARRGDMLFWGPYSIHHVALYLGNGMMIEAPYSGGYVRIVPVRWSGIMPYATRLIG